MSDNKLAISCAWTPSKLALAGILVLTAATSLATAAETTLPNQPLTAVEPLRIDACDKAENRIFSAEAGQIISIFGDCQFTLQIDAGEMQTEHDRELVLPLSAGAHVIRVFIPSLYEGLGASTHEIVINAT